LKNLIVVVKDLILGEKFDYAKIKNTKYL